MLSKKIKQLWSKWCFICEVIGKFQLGIIFVILFFTLIIPFAFITKYINPLAIKRPIYWQKIERKIEIEQSRWQF